MNKGLYFSLLMGAGASFTGTLQAQQLEPSLTKVASKIDTDGTFLQLNRFDGDVKALTEYAELGLEILKEQEPDVPKGLDVKKLLKLLGVDAMTASGMSAKKVDGSWNSRAYLWTGGSDAGVLSFYGNQGEKFEVAEFAPETADVALQFRLNVSKLNPIIKEVAAMVGFTDQAEGALSQPLEPLGGMTGFQVIEKLDIRANLAIDIDREKRIALPGVDAPGVELVARLDGASWLWPLFGDEFLKQSEMPWELNEENGVKTYTLPAEAAKRMMGYSPVIQITKEHIWVATKPEVLKAAQEAGTKLKDGAEFKKTMATLPQSGNSLAYISDDLLDELVYQYEAADKAGHLAEPDFQIAKPLVDKLIADFTKGDSGIAAVIQVDKDGINSALRAPFAPKHYLNQIMPIMQSAIMTERLKSSSIEMMDNEPRFR